MCARFQLLLPLSLRVEGPGVLGPNDPEDLGFSEATCCHRACDATSVPSDRKEDWDSTLRWQWRLEAMGRWALFPVGQRDQSRPGIDVYGLR